MNILEENGFSQDKFIEQMEKDQSNPQKSKIILEYMKVVRQNFGPNCLKSRYSIFFHEFQKNNAFADSVINKFDTHVQETVFKLFRLVPGQAVQKFLQNQSQLLKNLKPYEDLNNPKIEKGQTYKHAHEIFLNYELFSITESVRIRDKSRQGVGLQVQPKDVSQGIIDNCYFMSSLISIISKHPEVIFHLFLFDVSATHYYVLKLFIDGQWIMIETDDKFPVSENGSTICARSHGQKIWVMLLQKCYAKLFGSYQALNLGPLSQGFRIFTGSPTELISLKSFNNNENQKIAEDEERVLKQIQKALEKLFVISMTPSNYLQQLSQQEQKKIGLVNNHAYSILQIFSVQQEKVVRIMNPWGMNSNQDQYGQWKWSFKSEKWTAELKQKHCYLNEGKDGIFFMPWKKLIKYFSEFTICKITPSYIHSSKKLEMKKKEANYFYVNVKEKGQYYFSVYHESRRKFLGDPNFAYPDTRIVVLKTIPSKKSQYINSINTRRRSCATVENQFLQQGQYLVYVKIQWDQKTQRQVIFCSYGTAQVQYPEKQFSLEQKKNFRQEMILSFSQKFTSNTKSERDGLNTIRVKEPFVIKGVEYNAYMEIFVCQSRGIGYLKIKNKTQKLFQINFKADKFEGLNVIKGIDINFQHRIQGEKQTVIGLWAEPEKRLEFIPNMEIKIENDDSCFVF